LFRNEESDGKPEAYHHVLRQSRWSWGARTPSSALSAAGANNTTLEQTPLSNNSRPGCAQNCSRFALNADEGVRAPSSSQTSLTDLGYCLLLREHSPEKIRFQHI